MMKRIFVTGATGYIGQQLCLRLAKEQARVVALYRSIGKTDELAEAGITLVEGDLSQPDTLRSHLEDCDEIYHLAAFAAMWAPDPEIFYRINVEATKALCTLAKECGVSRMVITSTAGVVGPSFGTPVTEESTRSVDFFSEYERTKHQAEEFVRNWDSGEMEIVIVNPSRVYGPGLLSVSNGVTRMIDMYLDGKFRIKAGKGESIGNYCYIDDIIEGHLLAMQKGRDRERYLLGGENCTFQQLFNHIRHISGESYSLRPIPPFLIKFAARILLLRANLFGIPPKLTPEWAERFVNYDWALSSRKAREELGYTITPLREGLSETIAWLQAQKGDTKEIQ